MSRSAPRCGQGVPPSSDPLSRGGIARGFTPSRHLGVIQRQPTAQCARKRRRKAKSSKSSKSSKSHKACSKCRFVKPLDEFHKDRHAATGTRSDCKKCFHARHRRKEYGITTEQFDALYEANNGCCHICNDAVTWHAIHVDHCHKTNVVRGLLCKACNNGIGLLKDSSKLLRTAARYLDSPPPILSP